MSQIAIRCASCGRPGLPSIPLAKLGQGERSWPVAHVVMEKAYDQQTWRICFQGVSKAELAACLTPGHLENIEKAKREIWESEWDI